MSHALQFVDFARVQIPFVRRCALWHGTKRIDAIACHLSVWGVYVTFLRPPADDVLPAGAAVQVAFLLPGDPIAVSSHAVVHWRNLEPADPAAGLPAGCALQFIALRPKDHHRIGRLVHNFRHATHPRICVPRPWSGVLRIPYVRHCAVVDEQASHDAVLCNVSVAGAYVAVEPVPPAGGKVALRFAIAGARLNIRCEVAWTNPDGPPRCRLRRTGQSLPPGCGLRFLDLNDVARRHLETPARGYESWPRAGL